MVVDKVRVRYAPSPTGEPHVGNIRTALFDWLLARKTGGEFIVRVEDTDQDREVEGSIELQKNSLLWLDLDWDEGLGKEGPYGPYVQSERLDYYSAAAESLIASGDAYRCYCTPRRLSALRADQVTQKFSKLGYDRKCRGLKDDERDLLENTKSHSVVRFAMPDTGTSEIVDMVRGRIVFENSLLEDFVIVKADGFPTYHLASVVDDHYMMITHVLRGEEWVSSVPRHVQLYRALGWEQPTFAHLPAILAADKTKLSKRHGATSVMEYREMGYLPDAMVNFLSLLGWSIDGETSLIDRNDLVENFDPSRINVSGAVFDSEKLDWMNGQYIKLMAPDKLGGILFEYWNDFPPEEFEYFPTLEECKSVAPLLKDRLKTLRDAAPLITFVFKDTFEYSLEDLVQNGMDNSGTFQLLSASEKTLSELEVFSADSIEVALRGLADELGVKVGQLLGTLRVATSGQKVSPPLFDSLEVLGRDKVLSLLENAKLIAESS